MNWKPTDLNLQSQLCGMCGNTLKAERTIMEEFIGLIGV